MATPVIDWLFRGTGIANADGSRPATVQGITEVPGPATTPLGDRPTAVRFGPGVRCSATLSPGEVDLARFCVRIVFRVTAPVTTRGNLVESTALPFAILVQPGTSAERFNLEMVVQHGAAGWAGAHSANRRPLAVGEWYAATLVFDIDTVALLLDDSVIAVAAFAGGGLAAGSGDRLHVGTWTDGARWPFTGEIAALQLFRDIPPALEARLDAERGNAEWHLTRKEHEVRPRLNLGPRTADFYFDPHTAQWIQPFALAVIAYREAHGAAFVMYGAILAAWRADESLRRRLGALASDETAGRHPTARKSAFVRGTIHWSPATGAVPVLDRIALDYALLGEGAHPIGLPVAPAESVPGGIVQRFQHGRMFHRSGAPHAFEVHGAILAKFDAAGGVAACGFPISHEEDVRRDGTPIGKVSEFERLTIYWSPRTPATIVRDAIRDRYRGRPGAPGVADAGGPAGTLGFPTGDDAAIAGVPGGRVTTFERGSICWLDGRAIVCTPFRIFLGRLSTREEDRDFLDVDGQNDLYVRVCVDVNGGRVFDRKYPEGRRHWDGANVRDLQIEVPYLVTPSTTNLVVRVRVEVWESDDGALFAGGDDHLGTMVQELTVANAWGMRNDGLFEARDFGPFANSLAWSVRQQVPPGAPLEFFRTGNGSTPEITRQEYAMAFHDVDSEYEPSLDWVDDGLKELFYQLVVKGIASGGNCYGMALEAIYAYRERSRIGRPLDRFTSFAQLENDYNVRQCYQVGASGIWWFVGQFLSGRMDDPVTVFRESWAAFERGEHPVICVAQNRDFSGAPHCVLPVAWNATTTPWQLTVFDPNDRDGRRRTIEVDARTNRFSYAGTSSYAGGAFDGGRFHYTPWSVLCHQPRTPVWDAIMLLLGGVIFLVGDAADVTELVDETGASLEVGRVRDRDGLRGKLLDVRGVRGDGPVRGGFFVGQQPESIFRFPPTVRDALEGLVFDRPSVGGGTGPGTGTGPARPGAPPRPPGGVVVGSTRPPGGVVVGPGIPRRNGTLRGALRLPPPIRLPVATDAPAEAIAGASLLDLERRLGRAAMRPAGPTDLDTIRARLVGRAAGRLDGYLKRGLVGVRVQGDLATGERVALHYDRMSARDNEVRVTSDRARRYALSIVQKLGAGSDHLRIVVDGLAADASRPVALNVQPGATTIDVLTGGAPTDVRVQVEGRIGDRPVASTFAARFEGGQRLVIPDVADPSRLKVGRIDALMGAGREMRVLRKQ